MTSMTFKMSTITDLDSRPNRHFCIEITFPILGAFVSSYLYKSFFRLFQITFFMPDGNSILDEKGIEKIVVGKILSL